MIESLKRNVLSKNYVIRLFLVQPFVVILMLSLPGVVLAGALDRVEGLVMPGNLSTGHTKYEKDCGTCHKRFEKGAQNNLCIDCHKPIGRDVDQKKGLHGRLPEINERKCSVCHREHRGRNADIVPFDRDTFDHSRTDFELRGVHALRACADCHDPNKKYRKADSDCIGCHERDDAHKTRLGRHCNNCHLETVWGVAYFNHDKTDFKLRATHRNVRCSDCHPNERYEETPKGCRICHKLDDVHQRDRGDKCEDCHTEKTWAEIEFDHDKDTDYKLKGRHITVSCEACHDDDVYKAIKTDCITCHKDDDDHKGLFGKKCQDCHVTKSWSRAIFNHTKEADFQLKGVHKEVRCITCHRGDVYEELAMDCINCHQQDDAHDGQEGEKCVQCHNEDDWSGRVFFDHGLTAFPLLGAHVLTPCEECHISTSYQDAALKCQNCHMKDDTEVHKKRLGLNCELCHNSNGWEQWVFDHDEQTEYQLTGKHKNLDCHGCHKKPVEKEIKLITNCYACHEQDDKHNGSFGKNCERCHVTASFKKLRLQN